MSNLKHCPFCGGIAKLRMVSPASGRRMIYVSCLHCGAMCRGKYWGATAGGSAAYIDKSEAIKSAVSDWNQRAGEV